MVAVAKLAAWLTAAAMFWVWVSQPTRETRVDFGGGADVPPVSYLAAGLAYLPVLSVYRAFEHYAGVLDVCRYSVCFESYDHRFRLPYTAGRSKGGVVGVAEML